jgi:hypothetical protein
MRSPLMFYFLENLPYTKTVLLLAVKETSFTIGAGSTYLAKIISFSN